MGDKYGKNISYTATKTEIDASKTASKIVVQKIAETTGDLIGSKIAAKSITKKKKNIMKQTKYRKFTYL